MSADGKIWSWHAYYKGVKVENYEDGWGRLHDWVYYYREADKIYDNVIAPERERQREKLTQDLMKQYRTLYRPFDMAMIRAWSQRNVNDDPFSLDDITPGEIANMSPAERRKLRQTLMKLGVSYGDIANANVMDMGVETTAAILGLGIAGIKLLYDVSTSTATNLINAIETNYGDAVRKGEERERGTSQAEKQEKAAAAQELEDATAELEAAYASGDQERIGEQKKEEQML